MKCTKDNGDVINIPFGYKVVGYRFKDVELSVREIRKSIKPSDDPEKIWKYIHSLFYTLRPTE